MKTLLKDNQTVIKIVISDPWEIGGTTLYATFVKFIKGPDDHAYLLLRLPPDAEIDKISGGLMVSPRYAEPSVDDLLEGKVMYVDIAKVVDDTIYKRDNFNFSQVKYFAIGSAILTLD